MRLPYLTNIFNSEGGDLFKLTTCVQGGDNVIECVHEDSDAENGVRAFRSWNIPGIKRNRREDVSFLSTFQSLE